MTPLLIFVAGASANAALGVTLVLGLRWGLKGAALTTLIVQVRHCSVLCLCGMRA